MTITGDMITLKLETAQVSNSIKYEVSFFILQIPIGTYLDILLRLFRKLLYLKYLTKKDNMAILYSTPYKGKNLAE